MDAFCPCHRFIEPSPGRFWLLLSGDMGAPQSPQLELAAEQWTKVREHRRLRGPCLYLPTWEQAAGPCVQDEVALSLTPGRGEETPSVKGNVMTRVPLKLLMATSSSTHHILLRPPSCLPVGSQPQSWAGSAGLLRSGVQSEPWPPMWVSILSPCYLRLAGRTLSHTHFSNLQRRQHVS